MVCTSGVVAPARSQAAAFASDIAERMRANPSADALRPAFDNLDSEDVDCGETPPLCSDYYESGAKDGVSCTPVQMATHDINVLACGYLYNGARTGGVADRLPEGRFTISCGAACAGTPPSNATYEIRVFWTELQPRGGSIERSVSMAVTP